MNCEEGGKAFLGEHITSFRALLSASAWFSQSLGAELPGCSREREQKEMWLEKWTGPR